jgi:hypothetical protein
MGLGVPAGPGIMTARDGGRRREKDHPTEAVEYVIVFMKRRTWRPLRLLSFEIERDCHERLGNDIAASLLTI